jgi:ferritin
MLSKKMADSLNVQINREMYSAYLYLGMASYASTIGLNGFANWFNIQVKEELTHAEKLYNYVIQQGSRVALDEIEKPPQDFTSPRDLFNRTLEHEKKVTGMIDDLVTLADEKNDNKTKKFLRWFVDEQVEEEEHASEVLGKVESAGEDKDTLSKVDNELAKRR